MGVLCFCIYCWTGWILSTLSTTRSCRSAICRLLIHSTLGDWKHQNKGEPAMQLNISTDYAVRSLLYLATCGRQASSSEISKAMKIPDNYLYAVMGKMKKAGLAYATRGVNGGWSLSKDPDDIKLLDIIEVMEGTIKINRCLQDDQYCSRDGAATCQVHEFYDEVQKQVECYFGGVSLAQLRDHSWVPVKDMECE